MARSSSSAAQGNGSARATRGWHSVAAGTQTEISYHAADRSSLDFLRGRRWRGVVLFGQPTHRFQQQPQFAAEDEITLAE